MNLEEVTLMEINQPRKTNTVGFHLYKVSKAVECVETGSKMVVARFLGGEKSSGKKKSFKNHTGRHQQIDRVGRFHLLSPHTVIETQTSEPSLSELWDTVKGLQQPSKCGISENCSIFTCYCPKPGVSNSFSPGATSASQLPSKGRM